MKNGVLIFWGIIIAVIVMGVASSFYASSAPSKYDSLAQCMATKGVKMYGAFWCPHCRATKALFGTAVKYVPYVECSTPDGQGQTQVCKDKGIQSYPTWYFPTTTAAGVATTTTLNGEHSLQELASASDCALPR